MSNTIINFLQKNQIEPENVIYVLREDGKTVLHLLDGSTVSTQIPLKTVFTGLGEKDFFNIQKGVVVSAAQITDISAIGVYTMSDGRTFQGRKRDMSSHRRLRAEIELTNTKHRPLSMLEKCSLLDNMPLAFCVIELVFNEDGCGVDFIFRYCNAEMATVEGVPVEEMLNRSFYRVFPNGDKKWLVSYADVALNGTKHTLHDYSPEIDKNLIIHCYQPEPGYCACVLQVTDQ